EANVDDLATHIDDASKGGPLHVVS
ncbi:MAG: hypothetical protein JWR37_1206, partial [Mycobacterium sp.]|nr:hypothetical protein [Mycobacterium sp.]